MTVGRWEDNCFKSLMVAMEFQIEEICKNTDIPCGGRPVHSFEAGAR